jgi:uncharacterized protein (TIGR03066 family)
MKDSNYHARAGKPSPARQAQRQPTKPSAGNHLVPRIALIVSCLVVAGSGTWALCEFVIFNNLPPELVGKWVVEGGEQDGATFDFSRAGFVEAHMNNKGREVVLKGKAAVENKKLLITTQNPNTRQDETRVSTIRELTATSLIVEFETGEVFRMARAR